MDILLKSDKHHEEEFRRRHKKRHRNMYIWFPSAEDLILLKLRAGRHTDLDDVVGILERVGDAIDFRYLSKWSRRMAVVDELNYVIGRMRT